MPTKRMSFLLLFLIILNLHFVYSVEGSFDEIRKKTKALACIALTKARFSQDQEKMDMLIENINKVHQITDGKNKLVSLCLVNCFLQIEEKKALEIITNMHSEGKVDALTDSNKKLLGLLDSQTSVVEISTEQFTETFEEINIILKQLNQEHEHLKSPDYLKKKMSENKDEKEEKIPPSYIQIFSNVIYRMIANFSSNLKAIFYLIQFDSMFGIAILIILAFSFLSLLKKLLQKEKKKKKTEIKKSENEEESNKEKGD